MLVSRLMLWRALYEEFGIAHTSAGYHLLLRYSCSLFENMSSYFAPDRQGTARNLTQTLVWLKQLGADV